MAGEQLIGWQAVPLGYRGGRSRRPPRWATSGLYLRRRDRSWWSVTFAFVLLSEAMVVIAWARNWHVSWWEWHVLMLLAFVAIVLAVRHEWHEERFSALYLDQTLAGARDVSILFADLAGFTAFSSETPPDQVALMLNAYFGPSSR